MIGGIASLFGGLVAPPKAPAPVPQPVAPTNATPAVVDAEADVRRRARLSSGRTGTLLTPLDAGQPSVAVRTLLGG